MKKAFFTFLGLALISICNAQDHFWTRVEGFEDTMDGECEVYINGVLQDNPNLELGVFCGDECRDSRFVEDGVYYITMGGVSGESFTFRLYDHTEPAGELTNIVCDDLIPFVANGFLGEDEPYAILFHTATQTYEYPLHITGYGSNAGGYYLIAPPFNGINPSQVEGMTTGEFDLYYFDESQELEWINYELEGGGGFANWTLESGKGYLYAHQTDVNLVFTTTEPYNGDGKVTLRKTNGAQWSGWNLIGNPWGNQSATLGDRDYYRMNTDGLELITDNSDINPMEGVFVIAANDGEVVTFSNGSSEGKSQIAINVLKDRGNTIDRAIVRLGEGGTLPKFMLNPENTKIYIEQGGDDYAVVSSNEDEIPVSFKAASNGTYTLNVAVQNAEMDYLHLVDNLAGTDTDLLANPNYTFEANTGDYASRFTLVLSNTTGLVEHFAFYNGHNWTVSNQGEATLQVIDVTGRLVSTKTIDGTTQLDINAAPGVYMFRLVNGSDVKVQKVVVR